MIKNISGNHQSINFMGESQRGYLVKNKRLLILACPARQFMPDMPVRCMQDFYEPTSFASQSLK